MRYEVYLELFNGRFEAPVELLAMSDSEAVRIAAGLAPPRAVVEIRRGERLVARLQPEEALLMSAAAA